MAVTDEQPARYPPELDRIHEVTSTYARIGVRVSSLERNGVVVSILTECVPSNRAAGALVSSATATGLTDISQALLSQNVVFHVELAHLFPYTTYNCKLFASTAKGRSALSTTVMFTTHGDIPSTPPKPTASILQSPNTTAEFTLLVSWEPPTFPGGEIVSYELWMSLDGGISLSAAYRGLNTSAIIYVANSEQLTAVQFRVSVRNNMTGISSLLSELSLPADTPESSSSSSSRLSGAANVLVVVAGIVVVVMLFIFVVRRKSQKNAVTEMTSSVVFEDDPWYIPQTRLVMSEHILGRGHFGLVQEAIVYPTGKVKNASPVYVAVKSCFSHFELLLEEMNVMKVLASNGGHANVVRLVGLSVQVCVAFFFFF